MNRLPVAAFAALVVATVAAFFIAQHLKVTTPLLQGPPLPVPAAIDPLYGFSGRGVSEPRVCWMRPPHGKGTPVRRAVPVDYRQTYTTFYLQHHADHVAVYIVDTDSNVVRTIASDYDFRRTYVRNPPGAFVWNGRANGRVVADGDYFYRVALLSQDRAVTIKAPISVITQLPRPSVQRVTGLDAGGTASSGPALISPVSAGASGLPRSVPTQARIRYASGIAPGTASPKSVQVVIYRTDLPGGPRRVFSFAVRPRRRTATWNGNIRGRPAPAGTYLIGLQAIDAACNVGSFPAERPPVPGTTDHAGVTVTYLAAEVPLTPVAAGTTATVLVDSRQQPYRWALRLAGTQSILAHGGASQYTLRVPLPASGPGLYELAIRSGAHRTVVPLVASAPAPAAPRPVLVVLPALTWQGLNPVDDDGDGLPNTLSSGGPVQLHRPLANGVPAGFTDEVDLLTELRRAGFHFDLTTDLGLLGDPTALLARHRGVLLAGSEEWLPPGLRAALRAFVAGGGHVLSLGIGALRRTVTISGGEASSPSAASATDLFGVRAGQSVAGNRLPVLSGPSDPLSLFTTSAEDFGGITAFQPLQPPAGVAASSAGISAQESAIIGFRSGRGAVVEIGLDDFGASVAHTPQLRAVLARAWRLLGS